MAAKKPHRRVPRVPGRKSLGHAKRKPGDFAYLASPYVPLAESIRWAMRELREADPGDECDELLAEAFAAAVPRLKAMLSSDDAAVQQVGLNGLGMLSKLRNERYTELMRLIGKAIDSAAMEAVGRMQADVERGGETGINVLMLWEDFAPRVEAMIAEQRSALESSVGASSASHHLPPPPAAGGGGV